MSFKELNKEELEACFHELAQKLKKNLKGNKFSYELIIVGGASILLNYSFRPSTVDVDCLDINDALVKEIVNEIGDKHSLPNGWINTDFTKTSSYSPRLLLYSSFYKSYSNGVLNVRTVKDEYLVAMKLKSARRYKHDLSDVYGIIKANGDRLNEKIIISAIIDLYNDINSISQEAMDFLTAIFDGKLDSYENIALNENSNKEILISNKTKIVDEASIDDILNKFNK